MRLQLSKSANATSLYIVKSTYDRNGKRSNKVVRKLGTLAELSMKYEDPVAWGKAIAEQMTQEEEKAKAAPVSVTYDPGMLIEKGQRNTYNVGYLFLQKIYYELKLDHICKEIEKEHEFTYDLNEIMKCLVYGRVIYPGSKARTCEEAKNYLEGIHCQQHQVYRALSVLAEESDAIQSKLYQSSKEILQRNDKILYYDCTNFFFEIEEEKGSRKYGRGKEHRPNPIVGMGMFMDGDGIPLALCVYPGNENEQLTLKPLEKKIIQDFGHSKFILCTDAGLSGKEMRLYNAYQDRAFLTVQSIKKMEQPKQQWALDPSGWMLPGSDRKYDLEEILSDPEKEDAYYNAIFYKEQTWMKDGIEQRYIVSFSLKYKSYLEHIRSNQIERAKKLIENGRSRKNNPNDPGRFVEQLYFDENGEIVDRSAAVLNEERIQQEKKYDGFYCVATNLDGDIQKILEINARRWEIEESFRIMKTDFRSRPVYLQRDDRIMAHFLTCFIALYLYRILEKKLGERFTTDSILQTLRSMNCVEVPREGYIPAYMRTDLTDALHESFGFRTDCQILPLSESRKIIRNTKKH